jgi:NitT/TauT family transport system permease protein
VTVSRHRIIAAQWLLAAALLAAWEALARVGVLDPFFFSRPSAIAIRLGAWVEAGSVWVHLAVTATEAALAFVIGAVAGIALGFLLARVPTAAAVLEPYVHVLNALPRVVLAPLFLLWFGLGIWSKVALGVSLVLFVVFFNTYRGVRDVDQRWLDNARLLGASPAQLTRHVLLPSALSWIFASLHVSIGFAIVGAVVGEYLGAARGLGYLIAQAEGVFDTTGVFAGMAVLSLLVVIVTRLVTRLERWLLRWRPRSGDDAQLEVA